MKKILGDMPQIQVLRLSFIGFDSGEEGEGTSYHFYMHNRLIAVIYGWVVNPPGGWRIRIDKPHLKTGKKHIHIYSNGELVAINQDGTQHDHKGESIPLPKRIYNWIKKNLPDFPLPDDGVIHFKHMLIPDYQASLTVDIADKVLWLEE